MCGILGVIAATGKSLECSDPELISMRETMRSRGPDDAGFIRIQNRGALAHRRLAIRDLEEGQQPWTSDEGRYSLVYNGELYNTEELKKKTAAHFSAPLRTRCDTELLMRAFETWGAGAATRLQGMFACGVYDSVQNRLTLIRDRFGIKPLYFAWVGDEFVFASSPAAILKHPRFHAKPNWLAVTHYMQTLRTTFDDQTLIDGIHQLSAGCCLQLDEAGVRIERYWDYPQAKNEISYQQTVELFEQAFAESVEIRMVSDVPVGMMLSGGVDSSLLGTSVKKHLGENFVAQCGVGFENQKSEDEKFARLAADHLGCQFQTIAVKESQYRQSWYDLIRENALPLATPSDVIIYHLAKSLKQQVGVVLGGEGADELLCGYGLLHGAGLEADASGMPLSAENYFNLASVMPFAGVAMLLKSGISNEREILSYYQKLLDENDSQTDEKSTGLARITHLLHRVNLETLLARLDRSTMAASLEARVPYTDHHLVEKIWQTPYEHRIHLQHSKKDQRAGELRTKRILRQVASQTLPANLAYRKKASFPTPILQWIQSDWKSWQRSRLLDSPFLREHFQKQSLNEIAQNPKSAGMWSWSLLNLAIWGDEIFS